MYIPLLGTFLLFWQIHRDTIQSHLRESFARCAGDEEVLKLLDGCPFSREEFQARNEGGRKWVVSWEYFVWISWIYTESKNVWK